MQRTSRCTTIRWLNSESSSAGVFASNAGMGASDFAGRIVSRIRSWSVYVMRKSSSSGSWLGTMVFWSMCSQ